MCAGLVARRAGRRQWWPFAENGVRLPVTLLVDGRAAHAQHGAATVVRLGSAVIAYLAIVDIEHAVASTCNATQREWVRLAVARTWEAVANIAFIEWDTCTSGEDGIRIKIEDSGPHVKALGNGLDGYVNGMVSSFTFNNWSTSCRGQEQFCIEAIAVHELGHARAIWRW